MALSNKEPATWAMVLGLLASSSGCTVGSGYCSSEPTWPEGHACRGKSACQTAVVNADGGPGNADAGDTTMICGCCNG